MDALVTDAHLRPVLAGIRGLGRAGYRVLALGPRRTSAGLWSRYSSQRSVYGRDTTKPLLQQLATAAIQNGPLVVYPGQESTLDELLRQRLPSRLTLPYPDLGALTVVRDKRRLEGLAAAAGLSAPHTLADGSAEELASFVPDASCVVKPAQPSGALATSVVVDTGEEFRALIATLPADQPLLVQERGRAPLTSLSLVLSDDGRVVAQFQQVALRTWPPDAGISAIAESVPADEHLVEAAARMLASVGFGGLAQLQFVEGPGGGRALIDVNPRFYGSLPLALACGVNLPAAWHEVASGRSAGRPVPYPSGVRFRWLEGNLLHASRGPEGRRRAIHTAFSARRGRPRAAAVWAGDDPVASTVFAVDLLGSIIRRHLTRTRDAP